MYTTAHLCVGNDFYSSPEECQQHKYNTISSNSRYPLFKQTHFTAGDEDQFETYRNKQPLQPLDFDMSTNLFILPTQTEWDLYKKATIQTVQHTFRYLFFKFKKAIFIQIRNNQVSVMLPFSNVNFINEWHTFIKLDKKYTSWNDLFRYVASQEGYAFHESKINKHTNRWYANNALIRYEYPIQENDTGVGTISDMFSELCLKKRFLILNFLSIVEIFPCYVKI